MPRKSERAKLLEDLEALYVDKKVNGIIRLTLELDEDSSNTLEQILEVAVEGAYMAVDGSRYLSRRKYRKGHSRKVFARDLYVDPTGERLPWLTEEEFLKKYRMQRDAFWKLHDLIKEHVVFNPQRDSKRGKKQAPVAHQLLSFLYYIGVAGSGASNPKCRNVFGMGRGTAKVFCERISVAIRSLRDKAIYWPDEEERQEIIVRMYAKYRIPQCIAVADGTLLPLTYEPQSEDAPDYSGRKFPYSLTVMIINNDTKRIRHYLAGFPGSAHDNRVYNSTKLAACPQEFFGNNTFLIGDSAFKNSPSVVSAFKAPRGCPLGEDESRFNTVLGKARVTSKHTIGMLKARFPWLRSIPMTITDDPKSVTKVLKIIDCCIILHNLLVDVNTVPDRWLEDVDPQSDIDVPDEEIISSERYFPVHSVC
eukprot:scaffold6842_cov135-Amphora_coffeaeformis.AAC.1